MLTQYRQAINPPYTRKDLPLILGTVFLILVLPLILFTVLTQEGDVRSQAQGANIALGEAVTEEVSNAVRITTPSSNASVTNPVNISVNVTGNTSVASVEFWKDDDKKPFSIDYEAPYEQSVNLSPGSHRLYAKASDASQNVLVSESMTVSVGSGKSQN